MDLDYLDIYDDLDAFQQTEEKKSIELRELEAKCLDSLKSIEALQAENADLKKRIERIGINFQNLLDTAKAEIKRKDKQIEQLRKEKDDICFRRTRPRKESLDFAGDNNTTNNWHKNHSEFPERDYKITATERPQRNPFQDYSVADSDQSSRSRSQHNHDEHKVRISDQTFKNARCDERSEHKNEIESKREKKPRNNSPTDEHNSRYRDRSRERDRSGRAPAREYSRSRNRSTEHSRREERDYRNQKFDDYTKRHRSREKYGERSRYNGKDPKTRLDNQEYNQERRGDIKKVQHGDIKNEYKANHNTESSKKSKIETTSKTVDEPKPSNLFREKGLKSGEREIDKYDKRLTPKGNSTESKASNILPEKKLTKESLLILESNSGSETNNTTDHTATSNSMTTPNKATLFDKLFGGTPKNVGTMNITNELKLAKSNISSATTSPSKYTDTSEQNTKSPSTNEFNANIDECSTDSNKEFDFRYLQTINAVTNKSKPKECADFNDVLIKSFATTSTKETSTTERVISQSDDEDYIEINKTNSKKKVIDVEKPASDKVTISSFPNLGAVQILQNSRLPNIYEIRAYQRRLREEAAATENSQRESIAKVKNAEPNVTKTSRIAQEKTAEIIAPNQETDSGAPQSATIVESNKVVIAKEVFGESDINNGKNIRIEKIKTVTIKDGSKNSNMVVNANDLEKAEVIADTKSSANPNNTLLRVTATLVEEKNCKLKNEQVVTAMPIPETTSIETLDLENEVFSSKRTAEKSAVMIERMNHEKTATGSTSFGETETLLQKVKTVVQKVSFTNKTKADTIVLPECNGQSVFENRKMETDDSIHEAEGKCCNLPTNSPTENVEAATCIDNDNKLSDDIIASESKAGSLKVSKKPQQPLEDIKVISNNCPPNEQLSCKSNSCVDTTIINDLEASGENTTKLMDLCDGKTKQLAEDSSINIHSNGSAKNNKPTCDINNSVDTTVVNVPKANGENTGQLLDLYNDEAKTMVNDAKSSTTELLVDKNCEKGANEEDAQREIVASEATNPIIAELKPITTERNEMNSVDILNEVVGNTVISSDQLAKVDRIQSDKNVINEEDIVTDKSNVQKVFLEHTSIAEQKPIDQRNIFDESALAKSEKMFNCTNTAKEHSNVTEAERGNTVSSEISTRNATMDISIDRASLKLPPKPVIMNQTQKKLPAVVTNTIITAAALEKSVKGTCAYSGLIDNMKRSEIMWKFKIPKISAKRKRDDESEANNIKKIDLNEGIDEQVATKDEEGTNNVEESTNTLSKKSKKDDKIVKMKASEIILVPDVSAKIERERLLKDETKAEKQRLLEQEKSRSIIKEIDNWARRKVGETTDTMEKDKQLYAQQSHQISERVCVDEERSIKNEKMLLKSEKDQNYCATESNVFEKTSGTERNGKYNTEDMKFNVDSTRTSDHISDNRTKYKPQHYKHQQVDGQRVLSKEKLKDNESAKHCLPDRRNELEKVVIATENTKEKTDIPRLSNNNNSESKSRNKSPHRLPSSTREKKKHATKIVQQHEYHLTEEPKTCVEATRKPEEHKAKLLERRKSQNSEEKTLSKTISTISHSHSTPASQKQKSETEIQQKKTQMKKVNSIEEENEKEGQPQFLKGEKAAQKDNKEQSSTKLTCIENENKSEPAKLESSLTKQPHSEHQAIHVDRSTEVQKPRKEHQKMNSKKRTAEKTVSLNEVEGSEICEKRAKIDVAEEKLYSIQNVCDRGAHFTESFEVVAPIPESQSSQIAPTCKDTIKGTTEGEVTASTLPKEAKRRRSVTFTDANSSSDSAMYSTRIEHDDENKASVDTVTSTQAGGLVDLDEDIQHKNDDILDILQNGRAIDTMCDSLPAPQTPSSLPANISQDSKYEEIDSRMQLIFASPKVSDKTSTLAAFDKQNSAASDLIKVLQPAIESVNVSLAPMPISAIASPPVVNATPVVVKAIPSVENTSLPVVNPLTTVVNATPLVVNPLTTVVKPAPPVVNDSSPVVSGTPPLAVTAQTTDFSVSDTVLSDITINSFHTSSTNLTVDETNQSTINMNSSLSDSNASTKHISLGSSDYRFEKVSENVVNLFITRKRRGKRKPNACTATKDTIPTI
ncbi:uncharacterized protein LOC101453527 isoform X1 [Ceratitis capitata]|uniref:uncharacterized protein LOC101453527 isoform X1 n=1 Tax=Ceratitis capitata TaxID=7213 RepID=UPI0006188EC8|nr:uncharacterized protein LOC101453527 isoform X1 [Ceratitis capitata]